MWRKFGLKEAMKADEFVKTEDHRRVVLGIARMFNIPVTVNKDVARKCGSLKASVSRNNTNIKRIKSDLAVEEFARDVNVAAGDEANNVSKRWAL